MMKFKLVTVWLLRFNIMLRFNSIQKLKLLIKIFKYNLYYFLIIYSYLSSEVKD